MEIMFLLCRRLAAQAAASQLRDYGGEMRKARGMEMEKGERTKWQALKTR